MSEAWQEFAAITGAVWRTGNQWARIGIGLVTLWPVALALVSLTGSTTLISLLALVPVGAVLFLFLAAIDPLVVAAAASIGPARRALRWGATIVGSEVMVGVYFSLVPIANDPGLAPLLLAAAAALLFLALGVRGPTVSWLMALLVVLILGLTAILVAGGRDAALRRLTSASNDTGRNVATSAQPPSAQDPQTTYVPVRRAPLKLRADQIILPDENFPLRGGGEGYNVALDQAVGSNGWRRTWEPGRQSLLSPSRYTFVEVRVYVYDPSISADSRVAAKGCMWTTGSSTPRADDVAAFNFNQAPRSVRDVTGNTQRLGETTRACNYTFLLSNGSEVTVLAASVATRNVLIQVVVQPNAYTDSDSAARLVASLASTQLSIVDRLAP